MGPRQAGEEYMKFPITKAEIISTAAIAADHADICIIIEILLFVLISI
jgi:hypothetical protein